MKLFFVPITFVSQIQIYDPITSLGTALNAVHSLSRSCKYYMNAFSHAQRASALNTPVGLILGPSQLQLSFLQPKHRWGIMVVFFFYYFIPFR